ncbi:MAG TPA: hypothetical protein VH081_11375 [Solirubrobacteraceae bacterium]|nr:hypothetical protein [Solirubrobacteraceae bacterium]
MLLLAWVLVAPRTPDLAAAAYRVDLFKHIGLGLYDEHWYAGHDLPGYSVLFPPLAWLLGLRLVGALSVLVSVLCFERIAAQAFGAPARWASIAFAAAAVGDVWIGRLTFALGVSFALAAVLALMRARSAPAFALALLCAAASPVAGALLGLAALTDSLWRRSLRPLLALAVPAAVVVIALALLFPEGGFEPYPATSFVATVLVLVAFAWAVPRRYGELRLGAAIYLLACVVFLFVRSPMGSNIERYGVLLAGPLTICMLGASRHGRERLSGSEPRGEQGIESSPLAHPPLDRSPLAHPPLDRSPRVLFGAGGALAGAVALVVWALWAGWGPLRETLAVAHDQSTSAAYYAPVERFLDAHARTPVRLEVPLTRSHWETAELAPRVSLARGWEKQLDTRYDGVLLSGSLTAASYARWLREQAVSYVALPDAKLDPSSSREGELIRVGLPYLHEVFSSRHWRIYAVASPTPIASGPGRLVSLGHDSFALAARSRGSFLVRVHYTRYWTLSHGQGCVGPAAGGWTRVLAGAPGRIVVRARFSFSRALGETGSCGAGG